MKNSLKNCSAPSALFAFFMSSRGYYDLFLGKEAVLIGQAVDRLCANGLEAKWIYVCSLLKDNDFFIPELFQLPISSDMPILTTLPESFFGEKNPPGLVVSPFAAINLGSSIKTVIVLRNTTPKLCKDDVMMALRSYVTVHSEGTQSVIRRDLAEKMAYRIGITFDIGTIKINGKLIYVSISSDACLPGTN